MRLADIDKNVLTWTVIVLAVTATLFPPCSWKEINGSRNEVAGTKTYSFLFSNSNAITWSPELSRRFYGYRTVIASELALEYFLIGIIGLIAGRCSPVLKRRGIYSSILKRWPRRSDDLVREIRVWPWEVVLGARIEVPTFDGWAELRIPAGWTGDGRLRLRGQGWARPNGKRGDLFVELRIVVPSEATPKERELHEALAALRRDRP